MAQSITGSIQPKNGIYYAVINYYDPDGKRRQKWINTHLPVRNNRRNAEKFLDKAMEEFVEKHRAPDSDILYADYLLQWLSVCLPTWEQRTYDSYTRIVTKQLEPWFRAKRLRLDEVKAFHIQEYYQKKLDVDGVKPQTVLRHHSIVHKSLKDAVRMDLILSNPADKVILPKAEKYMASFYSLEEIGALLEASRGSCLETPILLTVYYGLRRSEVTGLRWCPGRSRNKTRRRLPHEANSRKESAPPRRQQKAGKRRGILHGTGKSHAGKREENGKTAEETGAENIENQLTGSQKPIRKWLEKRVFPNLDTESKNPRKIAQSREIRGFLRVSYPYENDNIGLKRQVLCGFAGPSSGTVRK